MPGIMIKFCEVKTIFFDAEVVGYGNICLFSLDGNCVSLFYIGTPSVSSPIAVRFAHWQGKISCGVCLNVVICL
jgi:hypothetical protein